jgi:hypothetical protein
MLNHHAIEFAGTTAGWLTGLGTPIVAVLIGAQWKSAAGRLARQDAALIEGNKALAILLADHEHVVVQVSANTSKIGELDRTTAVLKSKIEDHERWSEREHERLGRKI